MIIALALVMTAAAADAGPCAVDAGPATCAPAPPAVDELELHGGGGCHASGVEVSALALLIFVGLLGRGRSPAAALVLVAAVGAQAEGVDADLAHPSSGLSDYPTMLGVAAGRAGAAQITLGWANAPLVRSDGVRVLDHLFTGTVAVGARWDDLALELAAPAVYAPPIDGNLVFHGARLADGRLRARWQAITTHDAAFALTLRGRAPLGPPSFALGGSFGAGVGFAVTRALTPTLGVDAVAVAEWASRSRTALLVAGGAIWRPRDWLSVPLEVEARWLLAPASGVASTPPVEARLGPRASLGGLHAAVIIGAGLTSGVGAPRLRAQLSVGVTLGDRSRRSAIDTRASAQHRRARRAPRAVRVMVQSLDGDPVEARVRVDGRPCRRIERGQAECVGARIEVDAEGFVSWRGHATGDELLVVLGEPERPFSVVDHAAR
jgi:hypothetical protein